MADLNDFAAMNEVYAPYFSVPPARVTIQAGRLPRDVKIEIAVIAHQRAGFTFNLRNGLELTCFSVRRRPSFGSVATP